MTENCYSPIKASIISRNSSFILQNSVSGSVGCILKDQSAYFIKYTAYSLSEHYPVYFYFELVCDGSLFLHQLVLAASWDSLGSCSTSMSIWSDSVVNEIEYGSNNILTCYFTRVVKGARPPLADRPRCRSFWSVRAGLFNTVAALTVVRWKILYRQKKTGLVKAVSNTTITALVYINY